MWKRVVLILLTAPLCLGGSCDVSCTGLPFPWDTVQVELDQANCTMAISQTEGDTEADVTATILDGTGKTVELDGGQAVSVNGYALLGPNFSDEYTRTLPVATSYEIKVNEPSLGVFTSTIAPPDDFEITSPTAGATASLSGFTLSWSGADAGLTVKVTLTQTLYGLEERETFGPVTDTGSITFDADDLGDFFQGSNLAIVVTKVNTRQSIDGFNSGVVTVERSVNIQVTPGP